MNTVFFDVDTQIDFLYPAGALYVPGAESIVPTDSCVKPVCSLSRDSGRLDGRCAHGKRSRVCRLASPLRRGDSGTAEARFATLLATAHDDSQRPSDLAI